MLKDLVSIKFKDSIYSMHGISRKTVENHLKLYEGYVKKYNEIINKLKSVDLKSANQTFSDFRSLKIDLTFAIGGVRNHEVYFNHLGGAGGEPTGIIKEIFVENFGSYKAWADDLKASGMSARGWVWLAYDWHGQTWFNYLGDAQNTYPVWGASVVLALDTYEHAYWMDYGTDRASYIDAFLANLDWEAVNKTVRELGISK